ncbi:30S ribosomal protein S9 [Segniliparus rugosus ATCC BAA-974]|uniref:Small ribosomal subunit protein uS9 n=1 Tax=Segniliparus rugosus (strain ATCC BAA-974 / DSM 45345 / CCUG 50838 / CIP 108380 / JCM 13579 / CDC 945) TaxID=679197 RepID=E5XQI9_SEGRC|nr:30S ribosomal protein S9 [Segniliparus rugosus ATCC BAA-974]
MTEEYLTEEEEAALDAIESAEDEAGEGRSGSAPAREKTPMRDFTEEIITVGRRKEAVVRLRLSLGTGKFTLNGRSLENYFPNRVHQQLVKSPLVLADREDSVDIRATLHGGGVSGQAGALRLALARALTLASPDDRPALKRAGFLTRDARAIERKKYGLKKARKAPQYSKR